MDEKVHKIALLWDALRPVRKALGSFLVVLLAMLADSLADEKLTVSEVLEAIVAGLVAAGVVYVVPNVPRKYSK